MFRGIRFDNLTLFDGERISRHQSVLIEGRRFGEVSATRNVVSNNSSGTKVIDGTGFLAIPGFIDSHIHLLGMAAYLSGCDLSNLTGSSGEIVAKRLLSSELENSASGWRRFYGFDFFDKDLSSVLNRQLLDEVMPVTPAIVRFQSGHGFLLNSAAMSELGINEFTAEPLGATFQRSVPTGLLTGVFVDAEQLLRNRLPSIAKAKLHNGFRSLNDWLNTEGYTCVVDATIENDLERLRYLAQIKKAGLISSDVLFMPGWPHLHEFKENNIRYGDQYEEIVISCVKIVLTLSSGKIMPGFEDLLQIVRDAHELGYPTAIHAVERECVTLATEVLKSSQMPGDRIEHASEIDDGTLEELSSTTVGISTQPSLITQNGDRYLSEMSEKELAYLYRVSSMDRSGLSVGFSSDGPVTFPRGVGTIKAAMSRESQNGALVNPEERVSLITSLGMLTSKNSTISGVGTQKGYIREGFDADLVLVNDGVLKAKIEELGNFRVELTVNSGEVVYNGLSSVEFKGLKSS